MHRCVWEFVKAIAERYDGRAYATGSRYSDCESCNYNVVKQDWYEPSDGSLVHPLRPIDPNRPCPTVFWRVDVEALWRWYVNGRRQDKVIVSVSNGGERRQAWYRIKAGEFNVEKALAFVERALGLEEHGDA